MADDLAEQLEALRPRLHRYAARMMGSAFDGEDVVQDAMAKLAITDRATIAELDGWMFRVTQTCALDALRRRRRQAARDARAPVDAGAEQGADRRIAVAAGLATFLRLPPRTRSAVVLADVLGHSAAEVAETLDMTESAVKAALNRGRRHLRAIAQEDHPPAALGSEDRARLQLYADRFNTHDWDGLRALLAEDVRLDLVNRVKLHGAGAVSVYFSRYAEAPDWWVEPGVAEGRPALMFRPVGAATASPAYVVLLEWRDGSVATIRDFLYAQYVMDQLDWAS